MNRQPQEPLHYDRVGFIKYRPIPGGPEHSVEVQALPSGFEPNDLRPYVRVIFRDEREQAALTADLCPDQAHGIIQALGLALGRLPPVDASGRPMSKPTA